MNRQTEKTIKLILEEQQHQYKKYGRVLKHDCVWATILGEEFGEVCNASLAVESLPQKAYKNHLISELKQVAAVAFSWIEMLEIAPTFEFDPNKMYKVTWEQSPYDDHPVQLLGHRTIPQLVEQLWVWMEKQDKGFSLEYFSETFWRVLDMAEEVVRIYKLEEV